jgi:hypothetical protein
MSSVDISLDRLLEHPAIWRGRSTARMEVLPTGFSALDDCLPGHGWPRAGLVEILIGRLGVGELSLLMPVLAALTRRPSARWCAWIAPPFEPFPPALAAHGLLLERVLVAHATKSLGGQKSRLLHAVRKKGRRPLFPCELWAFEQALGSGACEAVLGWITKPRAKDLRRLQLAAERGRTLGILFRTLRAARESSSAVLRLVLEPAEQGVRITFLKSRGGRRGSIDVVW